MIRLQTVLKVVGVLAAVVVAGILAGWLRGARPDNSAPISTTAPTNLASANDNSGSPYRDLKPFPSAAIANPLPTAASSAPAALLTNWEDKADEILSSEKGDAEKAGLMSDLFPRLPEEGQVEVAQHISNLLPDENYSSLGQYLTNSATSGPVLDVLMGGLLNRPNGVKLPWLLQVAREEQNPKSGQAKDLLKVFLGEDNGKDWTKWQAKLDQWLKDNPD